MIIKDAFEIIFSYVENKQSLKLVNKDTYSFATEIESHSKKRLWNGTTRLVFPEKINELSVLSSSRHMLYVSELTNLTRITITGNRIFLSTLKEILSIDSLRFLYLDTHEVKRDVKFRAIKNNDKQTLDSITVGRDMKVLAMGFWNVITSRRCRSFVNLSQSIFVNIIIDKLKSNLEELECSGVYLNHITIPTHSKLKKIKYVKRRDLTTLSRLNLLCLGIVGSVYDNDLNNFYSLRKLEVRIFENNTKIRLKSACPNLESFMADVTSNEVENIGFCCTKDDGVSVTIKGSRLFYLCLDSNNLTYSFNKLENMIGCLESIPSYETFNNLTIQNNIPKCYRVLFLIQSILNLNKISKLTFKEDDNVCGPSTVSTVKENIEIISPWKYRYLNVTKRNKKRKKFY